MENTFHFKKYTTDVEINGEKYTLDTSLDAQEFIKQTSKDLLKMAEDFRSGIIGSEDLRSKLYVIVDRLLGEGSSVKLFRASMQPLQDATDICQFLFVMAGTYGNRGNIKHLDVGFKQQSV